MDHRHGTTDRKSFRLLLVFLVAGSLLLYFINLGVRDFWAPDEGDFAQIVRELDTDPVVPHLNNVPYGEKPPLFYYVVFAFTKTFRYLPDEASMRLASACAALVTLIALFLAAGKSFGLSRSITAIIVLGLTPLFYWQARYLQVDMVFSTALVLALFAFYRFNETGQTRWYYGFFIMLAFAFMAKGPLSAALAVPVIILYCISEKKLHLLITRHTVFGLCVFLALIVPWYWAVYLKEGYPFLYENILRQNFLRFFEAWSHKRPFYYYFTTLPLDFFPWSLFLPFGLYTAFKTWKTDNRTRFFLLWFLWFLFFLSLSSGKISKYMLPALPALAVIVSGPILDRDKLYNRIAYSVAAAVFCCLGITLFVYNSPQYREFTPERITLGILSLSSGICIFACVKFSAVRKAFACIAIFLGVAYMTGNLSVFEKVNHYKSPKPFSEKLLALAGDKTPWVYYGSMRGVYVYYVGRFAVHIEENDEKGLRQFAGNEREFYLLTRKRDAGKVEKAIPGVAVRLENTIGNTPMVIFHYTTEGNG